MKYSLMQGNVFDVLPKIEGESVDLVITSPPYWGLRSYGVEGELGAEESLEDYLSNLLKWVKEVYRVLKPSGSFVLNLGGSYCGSGTKDQTVIPKGEKHSNLVRGVRTPTPGGKIYQAKQFLDVGAFAYQRIISETDFVCRNRGVWCKPNVPSPIRSRLKNSTESVDWFVKDAGKYFFDEKPWLKDVSDSSKQRAKSGWKVNQITQSGIGRDSIEPCDWEGKKTIEHNWRVVPVGERQKGFELNGREKQEHVAPFPEVLIKPWVESLCPIAGTVLDPFMGSGTVMKVARDLKRSCVGIDLSEKSLTYARKRCNWANGLDGNEYVFEVVKKKEKVFYCHYCGKPLRQIPDPVSGKVTRYLWGCGCKEGKKISLSVG